ncbi:MAG: hypothetical protein ABSD20_02720 [Terriglobales bacterium]
MSLSLRLAAPVLAMALLPACGIAQDYAPTEPQPVPLGDIARQVRAEKPPKHIKVITNDDLQKVDYNNGAVVSDAPPDTAEKPATPSKPDTPPADANAAPAKDASASKVIKSDEEFRARLQDQKKQVELAQRELTVATQQLQIQASDYYRDPYSKLSDPQAYAEQQKKYQEDTAAKQKQLDDATRELESMKEEGRRAGMSPAILDQ